MALVDPRFWGGGDFYKMWKAKGYNILNMGKGELGQPKGKYSFKANIKWLSFVVRRGDSSYNAPSQIRKREKVFQWRCDI